MPPVDVERRVLFVRGVSPTRAAAHVERDDLTGAEPGEQISPSVTGVGVARLCFSWRLGNGPSASTRYSQSAPAIGSVERFDDEERPDRRRRLALRAGRRSVFRARPTPRHRGPASGATRFSGAPAGLRRDEHLVAPDDWRRRSQAAKRDAPRDVLARTPGRRQTGFGRHTEP